MAKGSMSTKMAKKLTKRDLDLNPAGVNLVLIGKLLICVAGPGRGDYDV